jgi:hypothetical protein
MTATLILAVLGALAIPATAAQQGDGEIHVTKIVVEPKGPDMNFTVYYESNFFTRVFSLIFGAKVLQPTIEHLFANFTNVSLLSIDSNNGIAKVMVKNISRPSDSGWYVYEGDTALTANVDVIEVHNSDGRVVTVNNANKLPVISNRPAVLK